MNMILTSLRALFVLLIAAVGYRYVELTWLTMAIALSVGVLVVCVDLLAPRRKLSVFAGGFFGLVVGVAVAYALSFVVQLLVEQFANTPSITAAQRQAMTSFITLIVGCVTTYLAISFILQTKDDFRFIIPYVEFRKQTRGSRPLVLDTSVLIDGRIVAILETGIFESQMIVPRFVLQELQTVADSADRLKRNRGRRGLDVLAKLQNSPRAEVVTFDSPTRDDHDPVDQRLITLTRQMEARLVTTDFNLHKVAQLAGLDVVNINELAAKMKPEVLPGERMTVRIIKPGEGANQGVGYLDDGTMVVIEQGRAHMNEEIEFTVTNSVQTNAGKMIFGRASGAPEPPAPTRRGVKHAHSQ